MSKKNILILGSKGMLGQMVNSYFSKYGYEINTFDKRFNEDTIHNYVAELNLFESSIVINCIGKIKQKSDTPYDLFLSNTLFPLELARSLKSDHVLIHPSTDCVFNGNTESPYLSFLKHTAADIYGISKSLGETAVMSRPNSLIIRVSIIGPDKNSDKGLLSWFLNNPDKSVLDGYTNHLWNGITTLEWSEKLLSFITNPDLLDQLLKRKLVQLGTDEIYNKYDILCIFNKYFEKEFTINQFSTDYKVNRCLKADIVSSSLEKQIEHLKDYMHKNSLS
jgi:dTDP-4-dehydrorhamnose reductase